MDTNSLIRSLVADLLADGLSQASLAKHLAVSPTWLNRWLNHKDERVLSVDAATNLLRFLRAHARKVDTTIHGVEQALKGDAGNGNGNGKRGPHK